MVVPKRHNNVLRYATVEVLARIKQGVPLALVMRPAYGVERPVLR